MKLDGLLAGCWTAAPWRRWRGHVLGAGAVKAEDITINMAVPDWPPTRFMKEEFDRSFKSPTGKNVKLVDGLHPVAVVLRTRRRLADLRREEVPDDRHRQPVAGVVRRGRVLQGPDRRHEERSGADQDHEGPAPGPGLGLLDLSAQVAPSSSRKGEWPQEGAHYYGFPQFPDTYVTYYRKDLFCNEKEAAKFQATFNQKLPCTYEDWQQVDWDVWANIGKHFQRKKGEPLGDGVADDDFYGIAFQAGNGYDFSTMQVNAFIWQNGGEIWDETKAPEGQALGVVNSRLDVKAFDQYLSLLPYMPPVAKTGQMDIFVVQDLFMQGKVAAAIDWVGLGEPARSEDLEGRRQGRVRRGAGHQEGGRQDRPHGQHRRPAFRADHLEQPEVNEAALDVVKWWLKPETQKKFVANGGQSGLRSVMADPSTMPAALEPGPQGDARLAA